MAEGVTSIEDLIKVEKDLINKKISEGEAETHIEKLNTALKYSVKKYKGFSKYKTISGRLFLYFIIRLGGERVLLLKATNKNKDAKKALEFLTQFYNKEFVNVKKWAFEENEKDAINLFDSWFKYVNSQL